MAARAPRCVPNRRPSSRPGARTLRSEPPSHSFQPLSTVGIVPAASRVLDFFTSRSPRPTNCFRRNPSMLIMDIDKTHANEEPSPVMQLNAPDPELLRTFVVIVENGSFTSAAKRIHRTQSAVSMQVRRLEEMIGCALFERVGRVVKLTNEGEVFFDHARRILRAYREALSAFGGEHLEGEVTIGVPDDFAGTFLPAILQRFGRLYPGVH